MNAEEQATSDAIFVQRFNHRDAAYQVKVIKQQDRTTYIDRHPEDSIYWVSRPRYSAHLLCRPASAINAEPNETLGICVEERLSIVVFWNLESGGCLQDSCVDLNRFRFAVLQTLLKPVKKSASLVLNMKGDPSSELEYASRNVSVGKVGGKPT